MKPTLTEVFRRQLEPGIRMLERQVNVCPDALWFDGSQQVWKHLLHAAIGIRFWFRQEGEAFSLPDFGKDVTDEFDRQCADAPTKEELLRYIGEMADRAWAYLDRLEDGGLTEPCAVTAKLTAADTVFMQVRHIQHHVGVCNQLLRANGQEPVKWLGYGE